MLLTSAMVSDLVGGKGGVQCSLLLLVLRGFAAPSWALRLNSSAALRDPRLLSSGDANGNCSRISRYSWCSYRASQGADGDFPVLPPDFNGMDHRSVPSKYCAHKFCDQLKASFSAREGCRHYVHGARHCDLPASCWIVGPNAHHFNDLHITENGIPDRKSVVMVRNIGKMDPHDNRRQFLSRLAGDAGQLGWPMGRALQGPSVPMSGR
jgi:hypothetical protein